MASDRYIISLKETLYSLFVNFKSRYLRLFLSRLLNYILEYFIIYLRRGKSERTDSSRDYVAPLCA